MVQVSVCCTVPGVGLTPTATPTKDQLGKALAITHKSTASLGKFMDTLPKEKLKGLGKKRKVSTHTDMHTHAHTHTHLSLIHI